MTVIHVTKEAILKLLRRSSNLSVHKRYKNACDNTRDGGCILDLDYSDDYEATCEKCQILLDAAYRKVR